MGIFNGDFQWGFFWVIFRWSLFDCWSPWSRSPPSFAVPLANCWACWWSFAWIPPGPGATRSAHGARYRAGRPGASRPPYRPWCPKSWTGRARCRIPPSASDSTTSSACWPSFSRCSLMRNVSPTISCCKSLSRWGRSTRFSVPSSPFSRSPVA